MSEKKFSREEIVEMVNEIIEDRMYVDKSEINEDTRLKEDLNADSLDVIDLVFRIENKFSIKVSDEKTDVLGGGTVGDVYNMIESILDSE